jgi:N-dimethylarginine dimethylaminohydrolase
MNHTPTTPDPLADMSDGLFHEILGPKPSPGFSEDGQLERVWGARWGASDEVGKLEVVMVRRPSKALREVAELGEAAYRADLNAYLDPNLGWYWAGHELPDLETLDQEWEGFVAALRAEGVQVVEAPELDGFTKAVFTRDPLVTVAGGAIIGRLAPDMRRGEELSITQTVAAAGMPILGTITGTGLVEGGSFVKVRPELAFFGTSVRCNPEGHRQLATLLAEHGITVERVQMPGYQIHLDLCCLMLDDDLALINPRIAPYDFQTRLHELGVETAAVLPGEDWGCNALALDRRRVLFPSHLTRTAEMLNTRYDVEIVPVDYREMNKNGGGLHCSSMELRREW